MIANKRLDNHTRLLKEETNKLKEKYLNNHLENIVTDKKERLPVESNEKTLKASHPNYSNRKGRWHSDKKQHKQKASVVPSRRVFNLIRC